jgi:predicted acylesterase/phospholipase RssA
MAFGDRSIFADVFRSEVVSINKRRSKLRNFGRLARPDIALEAEPLETSDGTEPLRPTEQSQIVGLSLSGGGIRSAAFCLGALQALREADVLSRADYLSTVSGGGYIGSSLSAGMTSTGGHFPFESGLSEDETPSLQHVRDHSNYLFPNGASDFLRNISVFARGLVANAILVLPFLLIAAALTIAAVPVVGGRRYPNIFGIRIPNMFTFEYFVITCYLGLFLLLVVIVWGVVRSWLHVVNEASGNSARFVGWVVLLFLVTAFCELQPFILDAMFGNSPSAFLTSLVGWIRSIALWLSPVAAAVALVAQKFGEVVKSALESEEVKDQRKALFAKAVVYVASAIVPLLVWVLYLQFSYWGVCLKGDCASYMAPQWLSAAAEYVPVFVTRSIFHGDAHLIAQLYVLVALLCLVLSAFLRPNANSLHPLYRDRLSKAFLFKPVKIMPRDRVTGEQASLEPLHLNLSQLSDEDGPYHLINTALNVQSSKQVNRRGRNADFFLFSRNFIGSRATDYVATADMEAVTTDLDLGTAMAASGAAASSNMGSATIKTLSPTLALLNIRLGLWLRNPRWVAKRGGWSRKENFYFLFEMLGLLNEERWSVYLTDGGHIENLGIYELLRRRCKVIIAVDAEADPQMAFGAFNVLERYALIDLGVRIELPWQQITDATKKTGQLIDDTGDCPKLLGPHVAVGEISYPGRRKGVLIYIKASLTGDENDYIFHYKKRYGAFPHETTLDQLFSEEQFEAYRALGFHAAYRFFDRRDDFAHLNPVENPGVRDDLQLLDSMFPLQSPPDPFAPRKHASFAGWLLPERPVA